MQTWLKSSFPILNTQFISDLQCFETFRNCCLFCKFWLLRNFYCGDALHVNYGKHSFNHHFQHCAHSVYQIKSVLKLFEIAGFSAPLGFYEISDVVMRIMLTMENIVLIIISNIAHTVYTRFKAFWNFSKLQFLLHILAFCEISTVVMRIMLTMANIVLIIISNIAHTVYIRFKAFWNFSKLHFLFTFWLLRKSYCGDVHHAIYGKHSLNHHLQHCAHSVYQIDSVLKLLETTVCFTHFGFHEISTPVVRIVLTKANIV